MDSSGEPASVRTRRAEGQYLLSMASHSFDRGLPVAVGIMRQREVTGWCHTFTACLVFRPPNSIGGAGSRRLTNSMVEEV
jgi:hypothetical protein